MIISIIDQLMKEDIQLVMIGDGGKEYIADIKRLEKKYPKKISLLPFAKNSSLETLFYAAADFLLLPSTHEPCGINQLIAMRYGCIPVVREVGGLYDTVSDYDPSSNRGTGFTFRGEGTFQLFGAITRALEAYRYGRPMETLIKRVMRQSHSWEIPAKKYIKLYRRVMRF